VRLHPPEDLFVANCVGGRWTDTSFACSLFFGRVRFFFIYFEIPPISEAHQATGAGLRRSPWRPWNICTILESRGEGRGENKMKNYAEHGSFPYRMLSVTMATDLNFLKNSNLAPSFVTALDANYDTNACSD
jgi:hypothetical protein